MLLQSARDIAKELEAMNEQLSVIADQLDDNEAYGQEYVQLRNGIAQAASQLQHSLTSLSFLRGLELAELLLALHHAKATESLEQKVD